MSGTGYVTGNSFTITCRDREQEIFLYATSYRDTEGSGMKVFTEFHECMTISFRTGSWTVAALSHEIPGFCIFRKSSRADIV